MRRSTKFNFMTQFQQKVSSLNWSWKLLMTDKHTLHQTTKFFLTFNPRNVLVLSKKSGPLTAQVSVALSSNNVLSNNIKNILCLDY